jgi:hypothetical protein
MGMFWHYVTFSGQRWNDVFGGGFPDAERRVIASYMGWRSDGTEPDCEGDPQGWLSAVVKQAPPRVSALARSMCRAGVSYDALGDDDADLLDNIISCLFPQEGMADILEVTHCGGDGVKPFILEELLQRGRARRQGGFVGLGGKLVPASPVDHVRCIVSGRRLGSQSAPSRSCQYIVYRADEVSPARSEIELLLKREVPWSDPVFESEVTTNILAALAQAERDGRSVFGRYG